MRTSIRILFVAVALSSASGCSGGSNGDAELNIVPSDGKADGQSGANIVLSNHLRSVTGHVDCNEYFNCDISADVQLTLDWLSLRAWGTQALASLDSTQGSEVNLKIARVTLTATSDGTTDDSQEIYARFYRNAAGEAATDPDGWVSLSGHSAHPQERFNITVEVDPSLQADQMVTIPAILSGADQDGTLPLFEYVEGTISASWR